jgi:hypothetical protein
VGDTTIVQYQGTDGKAAATAGAATVGEDLETAPIAANTATKAPTQAAATSLFRVKILTSFLGAAVARMLSQIP